jgi:hypothetical protein
MHSYRITRLQKTRKLLQIQRLLDLVASLLALATAGGLLEARLCKSLLRLSDSNSIITRGRRLQKRLLLQDRLGDYGN